MMYSKKDILQNVRPCVTRRSENNDYYVTIPFIDDLDIYFRYFCNEEVSFKIPYELLHVNDISVEEIRLYAEENMKKDIVIMPLANMIGMPDDAAIQVVTNKEKMYGAGAMVILDTYDWIEDKYIIPSSVHEVLLIDKKDFINPSELNYMIQSINESIVDEKDILSDHVYEITKRKEVYV